MEYLDRDRTVYCPKMHFYFVGIEWIGKQNTIDTNLHYIKSHSPDNIYIYSLSFCHSLKSDMASLGICFLLTRVEGSHQLFNLSCKIKIIIIKNKKLTIKN